MKKLLYILVLSIFVTSMSFLIIACGGGGGGGGGSLSGGSGRGTGGGGGSGGSGITPPAPDNYLLMIMQKAGSGGTFSLSDLTGTWNYHGLVSGDAPQHHPGWYHGRLDIDAYGNVNQDQGDYIDSDGNTIPPANSILNIASDGIVTDQADSHGAMNLGKDLIVITKSDTGFHLQVLQKQVGITFYQSDFEGKWNNHCVISGDTQWLGWERGILRFDTNGVFGFILYESSDPNRTAVPIAFNISSTGVVTGSSNVPGTFHGAMNPGKDLIVGTINDVRGGYKLCVLQRAVSGVTPNDLADTWNFHGISTGDYPEWTGWFNGQLTADASGVITQISYTDSSGGSTPPLNSPLDITTGGILTDQANSSFHGTMNIGKDLIIATMN